ncbi:MAG: hypothetical protein LIO44_05105 [Eubacterium sp.]|nr:hypothetical protein [Eubacterium sp.]
MIYSEKQSEKVRADSIQKLINDAIPYENEELELKKELHNLNEDIAYVSENAEIAVGFIAAGVSDLSYIKNKAETYDFPPVLIIDCTMDMTEIAGIVDAADDSWEIMLYASAFSEEINGNVLSVISYLESVGKEHTGIFLLRSDYNTEANVQLLKDDGFIGYTYYHETLPMAGQMEDGTVYFDYSYLNVIGTSVTKRLSALYVNKASIIIAFDMEGINAENLTEGYMEYIFNGLSKFTEEDDCSFSTVAAIVEELSAINSTEASKQAYYDERSAEIQNRIDELDEIIKNIYDGYDY